MLRCWKEGTLAYRVPQEYVPFVREDVKWVYYYDNPIEGMGYEDGFIPYGEHYYTLEMKGDTVINGKSYKPVHLYSGESINEMNDTVPMYKYAETEEVLGGVMVPFEPKFAAAEDAPLVDELACTDALMNIMDERLPEVVR